MKISVVVPCYNEQEAVDIFYNEICRVSDSMEEDFEFLFVNDGSKDGTLEKIKNLCEDSRVKYISFARNFGKEAAMYAGLEKASGDYIAVMDIDLQDPPELLPEMLKKIREGCDCVATRRVTRKGEPALRSFFARMFCKMIYNFSDVEIVDGARDYRLMTAQMRDAIISMKEKNRFSKGIFSWVGFDTRWLEYENVERSAGETKWSFWKLFKYSIEGIVAFSTFPLVLASLMGILFFLFACAMIIFIIVRTLVFGDPVAGWPSLVCIMFFIGGVQLLCFGIMGQYLSRTYLETKNRPIYVTKETNLEELTESEKELSELKK